MLAGVEAAGLVGVEDGESFGQAECGFRKMVVGDNKVEAEGLGCFGSSECTNTCIDADDETNALAGGDFENLALHSIALAQAMRYMEADGAAESFDRGLEQDDGGGSVHVIVAIYKDRLMREDSLLNAGDGCGHPEHKIRIMQLVEAGMEESGSFRRVADTARYEQSRDDRWE